MTNEALNNAKALLNSAQDLKTNTLKNLIMNLCAELHDQMIVKQEDTALDNMHEFLSDLNDRYDLITIDGNLNQL